MADRENLRQFKNDPSTFNAEEVVPDAHLLANMMSRVKRFGDIFNGKTEQDIIALLKKYNNFSPDVCLELIMEIEASGAQTHDPPDFYD